MSQPNERRPFQGVWQIWQYNWPFYAIGASVASVGAALLRSGLFPRWLASIGWFGVALAIWWLIASLVASWWAYDASPLYRWEWVRPLFPDAPQRWANLHAGLDESTPALRHLFPGTSGLVMDFFDPRTMTEPSILRARRLTSSQEPAIAVSADSLPIGDNTLDAVFLFFAAHEFRHAAEREALFAEIARVLRPGGRVVVAEHGRDEANFAAFGPGFFHFWPPTEWPRLARLSGLNVASHQRMTPFVHLFVLEKGGVA